LGKAGFRVTVGLPFADLLLGVHIREAVRVLQVQHRQWNQGVAFTIGKGFFQQAFSFMVLGFGGARLGHQQAPQASLGARRSVRRCTVSGFGLFDLRRIAGAYLDIGQAHLGLAVTQVCQLLVILLRGDGVATLKRFIGQALVGQAGATGEAHRNSQQRHRTHVGGGLLPIQATRSVRQTALIPSRASPLPQGLRCF